MRYLKYLLIPLVLLGSSCTAAPSGLTDSEWKLVSFSSAGAQTPLVPGSSITVRFQRDGQLGGSGGCNSYGAAYQLSGSSLSVSSIVSTEMACLQEGIMEQEQRYFAALQSASRFELSGGNLIIWYEGEQDSLNFVKGS